MTPAFTGLSAFAATPADEDGKVDTDYLQRIVANLVRPGVSSIGVLGSTGNYMYLTPGERTRALEAAMEAAGATPVLAGISAMTTHEVLAHARTAERLGAAGLLLAPMQYLPLNDEDVFGLFADVAAAVDTPILVYNNPATTRFTISHDLTARLAALTNVQGVKNGAPILELVAANLTDLRVRVPGDFSCGYSGDALINGVLKAGADAWYSVLGGALPEVCIALWDARNDPDAVDALHTKFDGLWALFATHGSIRVVFEVLPMVGLGPFTPPKPLLPLGAEVRREIETALGRAGVLSLSSRRGR